MKLTHPIDQDKRIAEYTLGLSPPQDIAQIQEMLSQSDPAAACALKWEAYLLGISDSMTPIAPHQDLFARIQDALGHEAPVAQPSPPPPRIDPAPSLIPVPIPAPATTPTPAPTQAPAPAPAPEATMRSTPQRRQADRSPTPWRLLTAVLGVIVVTLVIFLAKAWSRPDIPAIQIVQVAATQAAILHAPGQSSTPGWLVTVDPQGTVRLDPKVKTNIQPDEAVQLWTRAVDGQDSRSLGLLDPNQAVTIPASLIGPVHPGQIFEMTLEPKTGSATGKPEGPILFIGQTVTFGVQSPSKPLA